MLDHLYLLNHSLYEIIFYFFIFSFLGWVMESCLCSYNEKRLVNRGFLTGPICPIYGVGMCLIILFLNRFQQNLLWLFFGGFIFATTVEYFVGFLLETLFNAKWWDYSDKKFNIRGRICLNISLCWGVLSVIMIRYVVPFFENLIQQVHAFWGQMALYLLIAITILDTAVTVYHIYGLNRILEELTTIKMDIKNQFEKSEIYLKTEEFKEKYDSLFGEVNFSFDSLKQNSENYKFLIDKWRARLDYMAAEIKSDAKVAEFTDAMNELKQKYTDRIGGYSRVQERLLKAFPNFKANKNAYSLSELKEKIASKLKLD